MTAAAPPQTLDALLASFGLDGHEFELLTKWYLENDRVHRARYAKVWLWDDWPGRWGRDRGIDLIAETVDGDIVAIQAKNYGFMHSVTKHDVDTFLSESSRAQISARLLVATTDRIASSGIDVMKGQEKPVFTCLLSELHASAIRWPSRLSEIAPQRPALASPRPHQLRALEAIERWSEAGHRRGQLLMACGTGKSLTAVWAAERLHADRVLVLVPTIPLLRQTTATWCAEATTKRRLLQICSDTTANEAEHLLKGDDLGTQRTTDPDAIARALSVPGPLLVMCTYDSSPRLAEAMSRAATEFDLAIADEAHRCAGLEGSSHKTILSDRAIPANRRLFMTATPTVYGRKDQSRALKNSVRLVSMDDRRVFGPIVHRLSYAEAVDQGLLCPYQVAVIPISDAEVHRLIASRRIVTADGDHKLIAGSLATQIACARAMRRYGCRRVVAFHPTIAESRRFSDHFPIAADLLDAGERPTSPIWAEHVDGKDMRHAKRMALLRRFKSTEIDEHRLLSNVRLLTEGVDVCDIDAIAFVDTHRGQTAIIQAVGRAVRPAAGKTVGTIIIPIVLKDGESFEAALARSEHRTAIDVLAALHSHDPDILKSLDDLRFGVGPADVLPTAQGRFVVDAPIQVDAAFAQAVDVALTSALGVRRPSSPTRRAESLDPKLLVSEDRPPPTPEEAFLIGLTEIDALARWDILPAPPESADAFPMRVWFREAMNRWADGRLAPAEKRLIADSISWLGAELDAYPQQRSEMARLSAIPLADQILAQLGKAGRYLDSGLAPLVADFSNGFDLRPQIREIEELLTHAATSPELKARYVVHALSYLASAVQAASHDKEPEDWRMSSLATITTDGFIYELKVAQAGPSPLDRPHPSWLARTNSEAHQIGRTAARRWRALAQRIRLYHYLGDEGEVTARRAAELDLPSDERLDALGWDIFLLSRHRQATVDTALSLATGARLRERRAVRQDLIARGLREFPFSRAPESSRQLQ